MATTAVLNDEVLEIVDLEKTKEKTRVEKQNAPNET
jgi:hypothetical protein